MLSRLVIVCLPRSKCLLISWLQSPSAVILEPKEIKCVTVSIVSPSLCHEVMGLGGRREGGSGWGTGVYPWQIHVDVRQNQYNIVK